MLLAMVLIPMVTAAEPKSAPINAALYPSGSPIYFHILRPTILPGSSERYRRQCQQVLLPSPAMQKQGRGDPSQEVGRVEAGEAAGVEDGHGHGVTMARGQGADEEAILADQGVDAQGILGGIVVGMVEEAGEAIPVVEDVPSAVGELVTLAGRQWQGS